VDTAAVVAANLFIFIFYIYQVENTIQGVDTNSFASPNPDFINEHNLPINRVSGVTDLIQNYTRSRQFTNFQSTRILTSRKNEKWLDDKPKNYPAD
jgi:hypothetical protein